MKRTDIINHFIKKYKYSNYLEIGVQDYYCNCDKVIALLKHSVDPFPRNKCDYIMTSDQFFEQLDPNFKYDIIFIDGLHLTEQVDKDIENSLKHLESNGTIIVHDCCPIVESHQVRNDHGGEWMGDVWKSIAKIRMTNPHLDVCVVNTDFGCGIIRKAKNQQLIPQIDLNWYNYTQNYKSLLNLISIEEFYKRY